MRHDNVSQPHLFRSLVSFHVGKVPDSTSLPSSLSAKLGVPSSFDDHTNSKTKTEEVERETNDHEDRLSPILSGSRQPCAWCISCESIGGV